jgi:hypothetical protein
MNGIDTTKTDLFLQRGDTVLERSIGINLILTACSLWWGETKIKIKVTTTRPTTAIIVTY